MTKNDKLKKLTDLLTGKLSLEDFKPKSYCILIGWSLDENNTVNGEDDNLYLVNGKTVSREIWNKEMDLKGGINGTFKVTYGDDKEFSN